MGNVDLLFIEEENVVIARASGSMTDDVFKAKITAVFESSHLSDGYKCMLDARDVSALEGPSADAIFETARFGQCDRQRKIAVLVSNDLIYGLVRMYDAYNPNAETEIFENVEDAVKWLEVDAVYSKISEFIQKESVTA